MKTTLTIMILSLAALLPLHAQGHGFGAPMGVRGGGPGGPGGPGGAQGAGRLDFLAGYLGLTEAQKTQAQTIFDAARAANETAMGQMEAAQESLQAAIKANNTAQITTLATQIGGLHGTMLGNRAKADAAFYAILTADQRAKLDARPGPGRGPRP